MPDLADVVGIAGASLAIFALSRALNGLDQHHGLWLAVQMANMARLAPGLSNAAIDLAAKALRGVEVP